MLALLKDIPGINSKKCEQLCRHWRLMVESEDKTDLTRLESTQDIALKHYLDSALPLKFIKLPSPLLDIGTGAGFPGLVLKILSPETEVILGEVRPKRTKFLEHVIADLGLKGVTVFPHRIGPQFPLEIHGVVTRALESARDTLYRVQPFLPVGGKIILLKGPKGDDEVAEAVDELTDFAHEKTYSYNLASSAHERRLVVYVRKHESIRSATGDGASTSTGKGKVTQITSRANEQFKTLMTLLEARGIRRRGEFIISGEKLVSEALSSDSLRARLRCVIGTPETAMPGSSLPQLMLAPPLFRELDALGTHAPLLLAATGELKEWNAALSGEGVTVFLPFQDPGNVGAAIRSAAAFGVKNVVLLKEAASPFLPKAVRAAANALFAVDLFKGPSLAEFLESGQDIYRLEGGGDPIDNVIFPRKILLLPGVEGYGFPRSGKSIPVAIPISDKVESLNAQSALAIALYEISRRQGGPGFPAGKRPAASATGRHLK